MLIVTESIENTADHFKLSVEKIEQILEECHKILYAVRQQRPKPHLDTKILSAWNGKIFCFGVLNTLLKESDTFTTVLYEYRNLHV